MADDGTPDLITEFIGHPRQTEWHRAYVDARNSVQDARGVVIHDVADVPVKTLEQAGRRIAILFHVLRAAEVKRKATREQLDIDCARQAEDGHVTLALSPFGANAEEAAEAVFEQVGQPPGGLSRWIAGTSTLDGLRGQLAEWLLLVVDRRVPPSASLADSEAVLAAEMPTTPAGTDATGPRRLRGMP